MKTFWLAVPALLLLGPALQAEEKAQPRAHGPEWTNPNTGDPGVGSTAGDLQRIVVLCAADHNSAEFERAWSAYVRKHRLQGDTLDAAIRHVVESAYRHRQKDGQARGDRRLSGDWKRGATKRMRDVAMKSIQNVRA